MSGVQDKLNAAWVRADAANGDEGAQERLAKEIFPKLGSLGRLLEISTLPEIKFLTVKAVEKTGFTSSFNVGEKFFWDCSRRIDTKITLQRFSLVVCDGCNKNEFYRISSDSHAMRGEGALYTDIGNLQISREGAYIEKVYFADRLFDRHGMEQKIEEWFVDVSKNSIAGPNRFKVSQIFEYDSLSNKTKRFLDRSIGMKLA